MSSVLRIQYASRLNVHLLSFKEAKKLLNPVAPVLALLGDIGQVNCKKTVDFLKWCEDSYDKIYWVPGYTELSSREGHIRPWFYQSDMIQSMIHREGLTKTVFGSEHSIYLNAPNIQILMSTLWSEHTTPKDLLTYSEESGTEVMTKEDIYELNKNTMDWLLFKTAKSHSPLVWLTYGPVISTSSLVLPTFAHPKILAILNGNNSNSLPLSVSGKLPGFPWYGINNAGHSNYNSQAFWEYDEKRISGTGRSEFGGMSLEQKIREILIVPQKPSPALVYSI